MDIIDKFKLQRISQCICYQNRGKGSRPHRIENCLRLKNKYAADVALKKKPGAKRAHYNGLQTCGSVWVCPICGSIISERRKNDLQNAINQWRDKDQCNVVLMITFTTPHYIFQSLDEVLNIQDKAIRIMKQQPQRTSHKVWRTIMDEITSIGSYTGREVTFGTRNGWHPHRHEVHFNVYLPENRLKQAHEDITTAFAIAFQKTGGNIKDIESFRQRAVKLDQINDDDGFKRISSYVTSVEGDSWTLAQEATKGQQKTAKNGNLTPFGILDAIRQGTSEMGLYKAKYREYVNTMKGKQQFFPSPGMKQFFAQGWKSDQEIIRESEAGNHYAFIHEYEWRAILDNDLRGEIIAMTEDRNEFEFLRDFEEFMKNIQKRSA